jgi:hypothetical protein
MSDRPPHDPARPRSEPEIIPPGQARDEDQSRIWISVDGNDGPRRIYLAQPSPFAIIVGLAVLGLIAALMLILLLSVAVIWIPVVIVLVAAFVLSVYWRRFRRWLASG